MNQRNQKDIIYYSDYCQFSKDVLTHLTKKNMKDEFWYVCVDDPKQRRAIPRNVTNVPTLYRTDHSVIVGMDIIEYITSMQPAHIDDVMPMAQFGSSYSDGFSFIGDDDTCYSSTDDKKGFASVQENVSIYTPPEMDKDAIKESSFERYMSQRDMDTQHLYGDTRRV
jgi:glutaredoxin